MNIKVTNKTTISNHRNETAMIFKQICDPVITSYQTNIFSIGTLFTKVIKIIDQHDRLLRYPRHCSKVFQESSALQQQQISHQPNATAMFSKRISDADVTSYPIQFFSTGTLFTKIIKIIDQHHRLLRYPRFFSKNFKNGTSQTTAKILSTQPRWFLKEYQMLISLTIQYNSFQRVHFSRMLSK